MTASTPLTELTRRHASVPSLQEIKKNCMEVANAEEGDTRKVASVFLHMSARYYGDVLKQAQQSFRWALWAAGMGVLFYIGATCLVMYQGWSNTAVMSAISGGLIHIISGINFYLYGKTARQFSTFHVCLERMNRFLVADSIAANLTGAKRDEMRAELVKIIAEAPMLRCEGVDERKPCKSSQ